ncbi:MAG: OmpA family protein [Saprospiraceae bacterium]|nr:OmpA family protein [Saprospiraceae bacterium]
MQTAVKLPILALFALALMMPSSACVTKKKYTSMQTTLQTELDLANQSLAKYGKQLNELMSQLSVCEAEKAAHKNESQTSLRLREEQMADLRAQIADCQAQRDKQVSQVGNLTVLSQSANDNIKETLSQLEGKDKYIRLLQAAKTKADSINLALALNLKTVLKDGIDDKDVDVKVDKTVVFINLSDKMLYQSGSYTLTPRANQVLGKIAAIIESRPELEVMVEGYTDNVPYKNGILEDNWDLSVKRSTAVVRALQRDFNINPNRLIAAGRGEYNTLATNNTEEGRSTNRRTRIIILPKIDQFYDLLNPNMVPKK